MAVSRDLTAEQASLLISFLLKQLLKDGIHHCHDSLVFGHEARRASASLRDGVCSTASPFTPSACVTATKLPDDSNRLQFIFCKVSCSLMAKTTTTFPLRAGWLSL